MTAPHTLDLVGEPPGDENVGCEPTTTKPAVDNIPDHLKSLRRWVCWRYEERAGKPTKVPYTARTGNKAASDKPETWSSFEDAMQAFQAGGYAGVGIMLGDGLVGVDLDKCRGPDSGEVAAWAAEIVSALNSYTEISPSGRGIHIIARGALPMGRRRTGNIEMYDGGRYFTITGDVIGDNYLVEERQAELEALHARIFAGGNKTSPARAPGSNQRVDEPPASETLDLNPKANPPFEKFDLLLEVEPRCRLSWEHNRADLADQSQSAYDQSLANFAAMAGWTGQEIADLIIANRRKHSADLKLRRDYYRRTIANARKAVQARVPRTVDEDKLVATDEGTAEGVDSGDTEVDQTSPATAHDPGPAGSENASVSASDGGAHCGARKNGDTWRPSTSDGPMFSGNMAPWPQPMKAEAFYGLAGRFVDMVEPHTEADPNFLLLMFLAYAGNTVDRKCYVMAGGDAHYTNLFVCGVGPTSAGRKGSATAPTEAFFTKGDRAPGIGNMLPSLSSGEGLIWTIRDEVWGKQYNKKTKETEDVLLHEGVADKRLIVNMGEFVSALQMMRRQGNTLSSVVRSAWESGNLVSPTKNSPAKATGAHVTIVGAISKEELLRTVEENDADNGLLNRFLWCCSRRSKALPEGGRLWEVMESDAWRELQASFNRVCPLKPRRIARDPEAADVWGRDSHPDRGVYAELSRERFGLAGAATARAHAQVLRQSLLYAVLDGAEEIRREHLDAALAVWDYCEASARYVFGDALGDPTADAILKALRSAEAGLTRTELRDLFHRKKQEGEITRALLLLHQKGLARFERVETGGRPAEKWIATQGRKD